MKIKVTRKIIGSLLCLIALTQFSLPLHAQSMSVSRYAVHLTASGITTVTTSTAYIASVLVTVVTAASGGTTTLTITNGESTAKTLYTFDSSTTGVKGSYFYGGTGGGAQSGSGGMIVANSGLKIANSGTTGAVADVFITYYLAR